MNIVNGCYFEDDHLTTSTSSSITFTYNAKKPKKFNFAGGFNIVNENGVFESFYIDHVIYNNPATIVFWSDGTKTVSKTHGEDEYNPEIGLILCVLKKVHGSTNTRNLLHQWVTEDSYTKNTIVSVSDVRKKEKNNK